MSIAQSSIQVACQGKGNPGKTRELLQASLAFWTYAHEEGIELSESSVGFAKSQDFGHSTRGVRLREKEQNNVGPALVR